MIFHWLEIQKFIRKNIFKIIIGTLLFAGIFTFFATKLDTVPDVVEDSNIETSGNTANIVPYTEAEPAAFYFYVENEDGTAFTNNLLIEQYLLSTEVLKDASDDSEIDLVKLIEESGNIMRVNYRESGKTKIVGVVRNEQTNLIEVFANVGDSRKNLQITQYFFDYINSNNIPFLANKDLYVFKEPRVLPINNTYDILVSEPQTPNESNILSEIAVGVVLGLFFTIFTLWLISLFSKKLKYSFSYVIKETDRFLLVDKAREDFIELKQLVGNNEDSNIVVIHENAEQNTITEDSNTLTQLKNENIFKEIGSFLNIENSSEIKRIIYIIEEGSTTRKWYQMQRRLDEYESIPTFVVQLNKY